MISREPTAAVPVCVISIHPLSGCVTRFIVRKTQSYYFDLLVSRNARNLGGRLADRVLSIALLFVTGEKEPGSAPGPLRGQKA
jgi:hypothetical protein